MSVSPIDGVGSSTRLLGAWMASIQKISPQAAVRVDVVKPAPATAPTQRPAPIVDPAIGRNLDVSV